MDSSISTQPPIITPPLSSSSSSAPSPSSSPNPIDHPNHPLQRTHELTYEYLSEPNENLVCPICRNPFIDPVMCESTDHMFCRVCLIKSLEISPSCPIDRQPLSLSIVSPAPKIICKLVDELLVSCPLKSSSNCQFVCQRDLLSAHLRSHELHPHPSSQSSNLSPDQQPHPPSSSPSAAQDPHPSTSHDSPLLSHPPLSSQPSSGQADRHHPSTSNDPYVTLPSHLHRPSQCVNSNPAPDSVDLIPCPFQKFGCSFRGTPQAIRFDHLPVLSDQSLSSSDHPSSSKCPIYSVQNILNCFERLETRNSELKQELSQSHIQRGELVSGLESLKASFRKLWQSHQHPGLDSPLVSPSALSPFIPQVSSLFSGLDPSSTTSNSISHLPHNPLTSSDCTQAPGTTSPTRRCSDNALHISSSRLNYDSLNGHRIKHFLDLDPNSPAPSSASYLSPTASPALASKPKIRVSTFLRKGTVLTRATDSHAPLPHLDSPIVTSSSTHPSYSLPPVEDRNNSVLRHTALPKIVTQPCRPSNLNPTFKPSHQSHHSSLDIHTSSASQPSRLDTDSFPLACKAVLSTDPSSSDDSTNLLISHKILQIIQSVQLSCNLWQSTRVGLSSSSDKPIIESARFDGLPNPTPNASLSSSTPSSAILPQLDDIKAGSTHQIDLLKALHKVQLVLRDLIQRSTLEGATEE